MKTDLECFPCYLRQALRVARLTGSSEAVQEEVVRKVARILAELDMEQTPPANAIPIYQTINEVIGCDDPYLEVKRMENTRALERFDQLRQEIAKADDPLGLAIGCSIAGNIIDYGAAATFSIEDALHRGRAESFVVDHRRAFKEKVESLAPGAEVLYLADNCGEIVYDGLVIEELAARGLRVTIAVRGGAIINDALAEDARTARLDRYGEIISNGTACPGTPLPHCSGAFLDRYRSADLIISKGQGNFETLSEEERKIFFFLTVKCNVVGKHLATLAKVGRELLPGEGELVVYYSGIDR